VLLAEDNAIARVALAGILRGQGYEVELAEDGVDALERVRSKHPDIVIADVLMPRMDGFSLCRAIKEDPRLNTIPVVFYSATFITPEDLQLAESVGASRFVQKSADIMELDLALRELLDEFEHKSIDVPQQPLKSGKEIDTFYESVLTRKLISKVNELEKETKALNESERRYQQLVSTIPDVIFVLSLPEFNTTFIAPEAERLIGVPGEEVLGDASRWVALVYEKDRTQVMRKLTEAVTKKEGVNSVFRMYHRQGGYRWIEVHASLVIDDLGVPKAMLGVLTDITLRKRAEEQLVESEHRYRNLFEMMEDGLAVHELVFDKQGTPVDYRFIEVNPAFERLTGLKANEVVGRTVKEVQPGIQQQWLDEAIDVVLSGEPKRFERYDASLKRYFDVVAFKNAQNQFVALYTDVTMPHQNEETIRNLARFPEENPSPVLRIDSDGVLLYANPATELIQMKWGLHEGKPLPAEMLEKIHAAQQGDHQYICNIGGRWFSFLIRPVDRSGYINIYGREVTNEYLAQQELVSLNRILRTMSEGNRTLVHARSERSLLENICKVFIQEGDYPAAWVAVPSEDDRKLICFASDGVLKETIMQWDWQEVELMHKNHPVVYAFHSGENVIINRYDGTATQYGLEQAMTEIDIQTVFLLPIHYQYQVYGIVGIFSRLPFEMQSKESALLDELASDIGYGVQSHRMRLAHEEGVQRLHGAMMHTIEAVSIALEKRDPYTAGHQNRVSSLSTAIAREMGFSEERIEGIRLGSMVHDIGKISVPAEILNRPGKLTKDEFGIIKAHPEAGYDILRGVDFPWPIAQMIIQHHERMDGSGYPHGLKGGEIESEARILAVADVVEAITSHRPYRPSLGLDIALEEIERGRGTAYDPQVVDACLALFREKGFEWEGV